LTASREIKTGKQDTELNDDEQDIVAMIINGDDHELNFLQTVDSITLAKIAAGTFNMEYFAKRELAGRGQDDNAVWVGFEKAAEIHGITE